MKSMGVLRVPPAVELVGLDMSADMTEEVQNIEVSEADIAEARRLGLLT